MRSINILRFFRGYVSFKAQGGFPERFLNLCSKENIYLFDAQNQDDTLYASVSIKDYKKIREPARKSGMKVRITKKYGLRFFLNKNKKRVGLLFGMAVFFITISFLSSFLWSISITGCESMNERELLHFAQEMGLKEGAALSKINPDVLEEKFLMKFHDISWIGINISGSRANIEIVERDGKTPPPQEKTPSDIVASTDGQIKTLEVYNGTKMQKENSAVLKGDVLISGVTENRNGTNEFRRARGYVTAITELKIQNSFMNSHKFKRISKINENRDIFFFFLKVPVKRDNKAEKSFKENKYLYLNHKNIPIGIIKERSYTHSNSDESLENEESTLCALDGYFEEIYKKTQGSNILKSNIKLQSNRLAVTILDNMSLLQNICEEKLLDVEKR